MSYQEIKETVDKEFVSDVNKFSEETDGEVRTYRGTPVIYLPHKAALRPLPTPGLSTMIENAMSVQEVKNLLTKGTTEYKNASAKTIRKWNQTAEKRIAELSK